ncbi:MAG: alkaline phosphatase family protein [Chloroflexota bacterium]|nr:alkaline phosphatase family protein [Chloroflexota bacterium]
MSNTIERFAIWTVRLVVTTLVTSAALMITAWILPAMAFVATPLGPRWLHAVAAAILIGLINLLLRPVVLYISRPLGFFLLFAVGFLLNVVALALAAWLLPGFELGGIFNMVVASIIIAAINTVLSTLLNLGDEDSYYRRRTEERAAATPFPTADEPGRKLMMLEIDGLSYHHIKKALAEGRLPTLSAMMEEDGYELSKVDCGLPSQTSACQAGIMFGDNSDIPAFRWYDKTQGKLIVSSSDAEELNDRYAHGNGLMRGGTSVSNMLNGDAYKSLMTVADLRPPDGEEAKRRADDVSLLMLDPSFLLSTIARYLGMVGVELWEGWQQRRHDVYPRLNRLAHFYPFVRPATSVFVRDLGASFAVFDIMRGSPSIYLTWPGYDEVAHHSGPWTTDAFNDLARFDKTIQRIRHTIKEKAPGYYDLIILSDHGQSFGPTFLQRYGISIKDFIEKQLPEGTTVAAAFGGDTGMMSLNSTGAELANARQAGEESRTVKGLATQGERLTDRATAEQQARLAAATKPADVTAYGSGNLAQVYFDLFPRKITLAELNAAYPGMVDALIEHEGIGLVCGYTDDGTPIAIGDDGMRNLHTGEVEGIDPLLMYAPSEGYGASTVETRAWQVRRVMDFPHAGDLMLISTVYPDGTVAALEELIGSHGGLGGEQTDAFIFHPADMEVTETRNSIDVFHILNKHRGAPVPAPKPVEVEGEVATEDWKPKNLAKGLGMVGTWLHHVFRCLIPDRDAFEGVVKDPLMTGPALLVGILGTTLLALVMRGINVGDLVVVPARIVGLLFSMVALYGTGYLLTRKGSFARTTRAVGFAQSPALLLVFALYQPLAHIVILVVTVLILIGVWIGTAIAHETKGWKTAILPVLYLLLSTVAVGAAIVIWGGATVTLISVLGTLGIVVPQ